MPSSPQAPTCQSDLDPFPAQVDIHSPWGGVVPSLAQQAHKDSMDGTVQDALQQAGITVDQLHAVAVTIGPGLSMCLKASRRHLRRPAVHTHSHSPRCMNNYPVHRWPLVIRDMNSCLPTSDPSWMLMLD